MQMAQSRYLFAMSCFQMHLLREAETALCPPANEPNAEVSNYDVQEFNYNFIKEKKKKKLWPFYFLQGYNFLFPPSFFIFSLLICNDGVEVRSLLGIGYVLYALSSHSFGFMLACF